jgi:hypothetical protein
MRWNESADQYIEAATTLPRNCMMHYSITWIGLMIVCAWPSVIVDLGLAV